MNGTAQRERHTAVKTAERRIDDLDLVVQALSIEIVQYRDQFGETLERERQARQADRIGARQDHHAFISKTLWQRLRWLVTGR